VPRYKVSLCYSFDVEAEDRFEAVKKALAAMLADGGYALAKTVVHDYYAVEDYFDVRVRTVKEGAE